METNRRSFIITEMDNRMSEGFSDLFMSSLNYLIDSHIITEAEYVHANSHLGWKLVWVDYPYKSEDV